MDKHTTKNKRTLSIPDEEKPLYQPPVVMPLGELARGRGTGQGQCDAGTTAHGGCNPGGGAQGTCASGPSK